MKHQNVFLILVSILFVLVLLYFYDERESVLNKEYSDNSKNIYVEYPFFNDMVIDNYITDYLSSYIDDNNDLLFIDYDYREKSDYIELILYIYKEKNSLVKKETRKIDLDLVNSNIISTSLVIDKKIDYDIYNYNVIDYNKKLVALTFDDGPNHNTSRILDILEKYNVKATFFVLGTNIKGNEKIIKRMSDLGMEIGNHTYSHRLLTKLEDGEIKREIKSVDDLVFDITNKYPSLIRTSYGSINNRIKRIVDRPLIIWNIDTLDWKYHNSKRISDRVLNKVSDGDIVLMHDIYRATANSLEIIIPKLLNDGYQLVTISELFYYRDINLENGHIYSNLN